MNCMAQPGHSGDRACDRCRERRVKCDKTHPSCHRCEKLGKPCPGYDKKRKFVDEGVSLRKKYASSRRWNGEECSETDLDHMKTPTQSSTPPLSRISGNVDFRNASSPAQETTHIQHGQSGSRGEPSAVLGVSTGSEKLEPAFTMPIASSPLVDSLLFPSDGLDSIADVDVFWQDGFFDPQWFDLQPNVYYADGNNSCGFVPYVDIVDEVDRSDAPPSTEATSGTPMAGVAFFPNINGYAQETQLHTSAIITDEREHEMAYLIRHFTESIAPWMDLFDRDKHFGHLVPLKALRDRLLRNAIAAISAKQLGRVQGHKLYLGNQSQKPATMEIIDAMSDVDWFYKAANYYDKAIAFSREYLQRLSGSLSNPPSPNTQTSQSMANSDDLLVAVSIFSLYESLDNMEMGWLQHLAGLKTLLTAVTASQQEQWQLAPSVTVGRHASFWNFARADYQAAYTKYQKTLLDPEELDVWRSRGLQIQDHGSLYANSEEFKNDYLHSRATAQLVSHTLLWLVLRVVNYYTVDQHSSTSIRQTSWDRLSTQLDLWHAQLPPTFQPCAKISYPMQTRQQQRPIGRSQLTEVFFSMDQCAAAIQLYHFARILLLLNKPSDTNTGRLNAYREVSTEAIKHARDIVGVALGRPHPAVRVEMLIPLYVAGTCLEIDGERKVVLELLKAIEVDTGCSTNVKVRSLLDEWGWSLEPKALEDS